MKYSVLLFITVIFLVSCSDNQEDEFGDYIFISEFVSPGIGANGGFRTSFPDSGIPSPAYDSPAKCMSDQIGVYRYEMKLYLSDGVVLVKSSPYSATSYYLLHEGDCWVEE